MLLLTRLMSGVAWVLYQILGFMMLVVIGRVIISWVNADPYNPLVRAINSLSEPPTRLIKRFIKTEFGGLDLSPLILLLLIGFLQHVLVANLNDYSMLIRNNSLLR